MATAIAASVMRINPFDEPNVQESKDRTKALLEHYARERQLPSDPPLVSDGDMAAFGDRGRFSGRSLKDVLCGLFQQTKREEALAIVSFLPRLASLDAQLITLRQRLAQDLGVATILSHGPRYLHSIGQLYKGGSDRIVLLCLTADDPVDLPVADQPYTFGILKRAQVLGDVQAMRDRGRRVLRIHLGANPERALERLIRLIDEGCAR